MCRRHEKIWFPGTKSEYLFRTRNYSGNYPVISLFDFDAESRKIKTTIVRMCVMGEGRYCDCCGREFAQVSCFWSSECLLFFFYYFIDKCFVLSQYHCCVQSVKV